ncbi:hypothetical protein VNI00_017622 [Paramarasmius palmivorus]|uniref:Uncharacterized protein n=1 Tax=Paramarasmius palmivorus TaxID=297713 RepID=A0AAW0B3W6_9AGAR
MPRSSRIFTLSPPRALPVLQYTSPPRPAILRQLEHQVAKYKKKCEVVHNEVEEICVMLALNTTVTPTPSPQAQADASDYSMTITTPPPRKRQRTSTDPTPSHHTHLLHKLSSQNTLQTPPRKKRKRTSTTLQARSPMLILPHSSIPALLPSEGNSHAVDRATDQATYLDDPFSSQRERVDEEEFDWLLGASRAVFDAGCERVGSTEDLNDPRYSDSILGGAFLTEL